MRVFDEPSGAHITALIEARAVSKRFRQHKRLPGLMGALKTLVTNEYTEVLDVSDISFHVAAGEAVGYLGPNGACEIDDDQDDGWPTRE